VALFETSNSLVDHVSVMPRPGTGLIGSNADGIHFSTTYRNNHIRNCYVTRTLDDALIFDSQQIAGVVSVNGPRQITVRRFSFSRFPNGALVNFFDPRTTVEFPGATIVSQSPPDGAPIAGEQVVLTFDRDLPSLSAGQYMVHGSADFRGAGSTFEDNLVEDIIAGRGLWITGVMNVTADRNVIRRTSHGGISLSQDTQAFPGPPVHNITITNNVLEGDVGVYAPGTGVQIALGAMQVVSTNNQSFSFATSPSNSNVTIANNYIADSGRSGIWIGELNGGTLRNNLVIRSNQNPALGGTFGIPPPFADQVRQDALQPVVIRYSTAIDEIGDIVNASSSITAPVTFTPGNSTMTAVAATGNFTVQTAISGFGWKAVSDSAWLNTSSAGVGDGTVYFSVMYNGTGATRTGHITVAGRVFTVTQTTESQVTPSALRFVPIPPCRVMETRSQYNFEGRTGAFGPPSLAKGGLRTLNLPESNVCGIPPAAKAYVLNIAVIPKPGGLNYATVWPAGDPQPNVWTIRSPDGQIVANSQIVRAGANGGVSVFVSDDTDMLMDVSGYYTDSTSVSGLAFYPMTPCRVIDTRIIYRSPPGPFGPPSMTAGQTRKFRLPATPYCTVPQAAAYSVTLTAVPPGPLAYLTAWPDGGSQPNVSSINSFVGRVLANSLIIPASSDGTIDVFAYNDTDFLIDINGYYAPDDGSMGLFYFPITQCRASDSTVSGGVYAANTARTVNIPAASGCSGIPPSAKGYAINVTALPSGNPLPFITAFPTGQPRPNASILNAFQGQTVSNSAIIPAGSNGAIDIYAFTRTDVVVEVSGYFGR
jgi:hypothetical protein